MRANAAELPDDFDVVFIHDPQPAGILQVLEEGAAARAVDLALPHRPLAAEPPVWEFFEPMVNRYDAAVFTRGVRRSPASGPSCVHPAVDRSAQPEEPRR